MGRCGPAGDSRRRDARNSHLSSPAIELRVLADTSDDNELGRAIVREYVVATAHEQAAPGRDPDIDALIPYIPDWHDFAGRYVRTGGTFVIANVDGELAGCVGVTRLDDTTCEMNRLWVRKPYRKLGLGRQLAIASMDAARALGFTRMLLDVLPRRTGAIALYESLGFVQVPPIHEYAFPMVFLGRDL